MKRKSFLAVLIIVLIANMNVFTILEPSKGAMVLENEISMRNSNCFGNVLYVGGNGPDNYTKIQDAIDDASDDDTIYVYNNEYYENLIVDKSIDLIGENKEHTIIDGDRRGDVIQVIEDNVSISRFTVRNGGRTNAREGGGIKLDPSSHSMITENIIINNHMYGIWLAENTSSHNIISHNIVSGNGRSDYKKHAYFNIWLYKSSHNQILNNTISNAQGMGLSICYWSTNTIVSGNNITNNKYGGIRSRHSYNNTISGNNIVNNSVFGIQLLIASANNTIKSNNIMNNPPINAFFTLTNPFKPNQWDRNYWGKSRFLPKVIFGTLHPNLDIPIGLPFFTIDWHPAKEPYILL